jgi:hypothetical protein
MNDGELRMRRLIAAEADHEQPVLPHQHGRIAQQHLGTRLDMADSEAALGEMAGEVDGVGGGSEGKKQSQAKRPLPPLRGKAAETWRTQ